MCVYNYYYVPDYTLALQFVSEFTPQSQYFVYFPNKALVSLYLYSINN